MNRDYLKSIIIDHKENYLGNPMITRNYSLENEVNHCFVGIRRTGKSFMMFQKIKNLRESGVSLERILYINFEDERLLGISKDDLNLIFEIGLEMAGEEGKPYFFLDEIQNVSGWEKFVRRLADMKYNVNVTGSNSKMLSKEIASTLGGRFVVVNVYPYSFDEYLSALKIKMPDQTIGTKKTAEILKAATDYVEYGAFPELVGIKNKAEYLTSIYQTVYIGDILTRHSINNDFAVRLMLRKIAESVSRPLSFSRLTNIVKSAGLSIGKQTIINYTEYTLDSYLLFSIPNYLGKLLEKETSPKYYFMDTGFLKILNLDTYSKQLENAVAIELIRRYGQENVFYLESNIEIDFFVPSEKLAIQVSYEALDNPNTKERELSAFKKMKKYIPDARCILITNSEEAKEEYDNISIDVMPLWKFLIAK